MRGLVPLRVGVELLLDRHCVGARGFDWYRVENEMGVDDGQDTNIGQETRANIKVSLIATLTAYLFKAGTYE